MYISTKKIASYYKIVAYILIFIGTLFFFSTVSVELLNTYNFSLTKAIISQLVLGLGIGLFAMNFLYKKISIKTLQNLTPLLFIGSSIVFFLILTPLGVTSNGATRWIDLGFTTIQPSELIKLTSILFFAHLFSKKFKSKGIKYPLMIKSIFLLFIFILAYIQPDYGFFIITASGLFAIAFVRGIDLKYWFIIGISTFLFAFFVVINVPYVAERLNTTYKIITGTLTEVDYYKGAYQTTRSIDIIRNSGLTGTGFILGTEKYGSIPEITTDSIMVLILEEVGFIGGVIIILLFTLLIVLGFIISLRSQNPFATLAGVGICTLLATQIFINIFSVFGITLTGVPLPLFSRGGTSILLTLISIGIILMISRSRV